MIASLGALLLIAAGGYAGFSALNRVQTSLLRAEEMLRAAQEMRTEIVHYRTPLPQLLERLGERYPCLFPETKNAAGLIRDFSFFSVWKASIQCAALPAVLEEPLLRLGMQLSSGADPETALNAFSDAVRFVRDSFLARKNAAVRLYPSLGLAAGCLLAVLLL